MVAAPTAGTVRRRPAGGCTRCSRTRRSSAPPSSATSTSDPSTSASRVTCPPDEFRRLRAANCDELIRRIDALRDADPPIDIRSHPVTAALRAEPTPFADRSVQAPRGPARRRAVRVDRACCGCATASPGARCSATTTAIRRRRSWRPPATSNDVRRPRLEFAADEIRAAWGCGGPPPRSADPPAGANGVDTGLRPLRAVAVARRRRRRPRGGVARRLAVLQPQPGGIAPAGAALPRHQHGAVRPAGAAGRPGRRPLPPRLPLDQRAPRRAARRCAPSPSPSPCSTWRCTSSPSPCSCRPRRRAWSRQAIVPALVDEPDQLVAANSRLARLNVIAGARRRGDRRRRAVADVVAGADAGARLRHVHRLGRLHAHAAVDHTARGAHAERRVRGAARPDDRRHGVGVHRRPRRRRLLRLRAGLRPAPGERAGVDVRRGRRRLRRRHVRRQRRRPAAAPPLRRGPADRRRARRAGDRRRLRRARRLPRPRRARVARPRRRRRRSPARASTRWSRRTHRSPRRVARSPASRPASSSAGSPARSPPRRSPSRPGSAWPSPRSP